MAAQGSEGDGSPGGRETATQGQASRDGSELLAAAGESLIHPTQTPLFHAQNAARYERQSLILTYEEQYSCRLVILIDQIWPYAINVFEELIFDADPQQDLHILLATPGGDGETAVRLVRSAQARCRELTVIVPDQAKSAGTILALGAHRILMGPTSDLGPIDPQVPVGATTPGQPVTLAPAKDLIAAVEAAEKAVQAAPDTYPLHAALLSDVTDLLVQQARSALARSEDILAEVLESNPDRSSDEIHRLKERIHSRLIDAPKSHAAICGSREANELGLPVTEVDTTSSQWQLLWRLWMKYWALDQRIYEGHKSSQVAGMPRGF